MPFAAPRPCLSCGRLSNGSRCPEHATERAQAYERWCGASASRGYDNDWRQFTRGYLQRYPLCVECLKEGVAVAATDVDHIIPARSYHGGFYDEDNLQPLCHSHHSAKTAREDQAFGNEPARR